MKLKAILSRSAFIIFAYSLACTNAIINCDFRNHTTNQYSCLVCSHQLYKNTNIVINGFHEKGKNDSSVRFLGFFDSTINKLPNTIFTKFPNLVELSIQTVKLNIFDRESLKGAKSLKSLWAKGNEVKKLSADIFLEATNLQEFSFHDNSIRTVDKNAFRKLKKLERMYMGRNGILELHKDTFSDLVKLKAIFFIDNLIQKLDKGLFRNNPELEVVQLYNNRIRVISPDIFKHLKMMTYVNLYKNVCINKSFNDKYKSIKTLDTNILVCTEDNTLESKNIKLMSELDSTQIKLSVVTSDVLVLSHKLEQNLKCENATALKSIEILKLQNNNDRLLQEISKLSYNCSQNIVQMSEKLFSVNQTLNSLQKSFESVSNANKLLEDKSFDLFNELEELKTNYSNLILENESSEKIQNDFMVELQNELNELKINCSNIIIENKLSSEAQNVSNIELQHIIKNLNESNSGLEKQNLKLTIELHDIKVNNFLMVSALKVSEELNAKEVIENQKAVFKVEQSNKLMLEENKSLSNELNKLKLQNINLIEEIEKLKTNIAEKTNETRVLMETKDLQEQSYKKLEMELVLEKSNFQQAQQNLDEFNLTFAVIESATKVLKEQHFLLVDELKENQREKLNLTQNFEKLKLGLENSNNKKDLCLKDLNEAQESKIKTENELFDLQIELQELNETCAYSKEQSQNDLELTKTELLQFKKQHDELNKIYQSVAESSANYQSLLRNCTNAKQILQTMEEDCQIKLFVELNQLDLDKESLKSLNENLTSDLTKNKIDYLSLQKSFIELEITKNITKNELLENQKLLSEFKQNFEVLNKNCDENLRDYNNLKHEALEQKDELIKAINSATICQEKELKNQESIKMLQSAVVDCESEYANN